MCIYFGLHKVSYLKDTLFRHGLTSFGKFFLNFEQLRIIQIKDCSIF